MHFIEMRFISNRVVFSTMTPEQIGHYLFSFFTEEERAGLQEDMQFCMNNGWLHPTEDASFYAGLGRQPFAVDPATNQLTITYIAHNIEHLCENLFDPPKTGINPVKNYVDANPSEGTYSLAVFDSNGNDVTSTYSKL